MLQGSFFDFLNLLSRSRCRQRVACWPRRGTSWLNHAAECSCRLPAFGPCRAREQGCGLPEQGVGKAAGGALQPTAGGGAVPTPELGGKFNAWLLYTYDAADDLTHLELAGLSVLRTRQKHNLH